MDNTFAIAYRRGPAWVAGTPVFAQPLQDHLAYQRGLLQRGVLRLGGPFLDDTGGLVVVQVDSLEEAEALVRADPAVRSGVMVAQAHPWKLMAGTL